jgi:hypothetical protein
MRSFGLGGCAPVIPINARLSEIAAIAATTSPNANAAMTMGFRYRAANPHHPYASPVAALRRIAPRKKRADFCHSPHLFPVLSVAATHVRRDRILFDRPMRFPAYSAAVSTG